MDSGSYHTQNARKGRVQMHLKGVREDDGWVFSGWELTYPTGWEGILKAVALTYHYLDHPEILIDGKPWETGGEDEIKDIPESGNMTVRGFSKILSAPVSITLYNQLAAVDVTVAGETDEFRDTDYEKFNHSMCQFMDSIEIAMYR